MDLSAIEPRVQLAGIVLLIIVVVGIMVMGRGLSLKFGRAELRLDTLDDKANKIKSKAESTDRQLNGRSATDTTVSADVAYIRSNLDDMRNEMYRYHGLVAEIQAAAAAAAGDARVVKELVMKQVGLLAAHQAQIAGLHATVQEHGKQINGS